MTLQDVRASLTVQRLTGALGAEVGGVDLRRDGSPKLADELRSLLDEHLVLVFRDHEMSAEQHVEIAGLLGCAGAAEPWRTFGEASHYHGGIANDQIRGAEIPPFTNAWHTDQSFLAEPPVVGTIRSPVIPRVGGDTAWVSLYGVFDGLSAPMQALCESVHGEHTWEIMRKGHVEPRGTEYVARMEATFPPVLHPLVMTQPRTGRRHLYIGGERGGWMSRIAELTPDESDMLLVYLWRQLNKIDYQFRWRWSPGDFIIWDEQTTNHIGLADHWVHDPDRVVTSVWVYPPSVA
jgi:taurine dioxygenase